MRTRKAFHDGALMALALSTATWMACSNGAHTAMPDGGELATGSDDGGAEDGAMPPAATGDTPCDEAGDPALSNLNAKCVAPAKCNGMPAGSAYACGTAGEVCCKCKVPDLTKCTGGVVVDNQPGECPVFECDTPIGA